MAGLNCGVTLARLGALLLGAALLPRGAGGECGSASARGAEWPRWPASLPRAGRGRRCAREGGAELEQGQRSPEAPMTRGARDCPASGRAASGAVALPSWILSDVDLGAGGDT